MARLVVDWLILGCGLGKRAGGNIPKLINGFRWGLQVGQCREKEFLKVCSWQRQLGFSIHVHLKDVHRLNGGLIAVIETYVHGEDHVVDGKGVVFRVLLLNASPQRGQGCLGRDAWGGGGYGGCLGCCGRRPGSDGWLRRRDEGHPAKDQALNRIVIANGNHDFGAGAHDWNAVDFAAEGHDLELVNGDDVGISACGRDGLARGRRAGRRDCLNASEDHGIPYGDGGQQLVGREIGDGDSHCLIVRLWQSGNEIAFVLAQVAAEGQGPRSLVEVEEVGRILGAYNVRRGSEFLGAALHRPVTHCNSDQRIVLDGRESGVWLVFVDNVKRVGDGWQL